MDIRRYFGGSTSKNTEPKIKKQDATTDNKKRKRNSTSQQKVTDKDLKTNKPSQTKKKRTAIVFDSDSDEDPIPPSLRSKKTNSKQVKRIISSDEDDVNSNHKPKKVLATPAVSASKRQKVVPQVSPAKKQVTVEDFFGKTPVKRVNRSIFPDRKEKVKEVDVPAASVDDEFHDDDEFLATLNQLDNEQKQPRKKRVEQKPHPVVDKPPSDEEDFLPSKKLAAKAKAAKEESSKIEESKPQHSKSSTPGKKKEVAHGKNSKSPEAKVEENERTTPVSLKKTGSNYREYLNRSGPTALGSKTIPEGKPDCFRGLTFVVTGVLESLERDDAAELIKKYGGKVVQSVSKNTRYMVVGRDAGPSKLEKAEKFGIKQLDEDGLLELIATQPGPGNSAKVQTTTKNKKGGLQSTQSKQPEVKNINTTLPKGTKVTKKTPLKGRKVEENAADEADGTSNIVEKKSVPGDSMLWVEKYKPTSLKQIIGQQGDRSNAKKLQVWLKNWHKNNRSGEVKKKPPFINGRFSANDDGSAFKAALLSGPPGVGKTTTASLVSQEAGFTFVELNASDTRSKKSLQVEVQGLLGNQSLAQFGDGEKHVAFSSKHCLLMDEVDGMAGNEDRGGVQELIQLIKSSKVPIICMCNDRNHPKIRSLSNHCFDLRFQKPRVEQLKAAMMSICFKEKLTVPPEVMQEIIVGTNQDVRQIIHHLHMWSTKSREPSSNTGERRFKKDTKMGPWDALKKVFSAEDHKTMSIHDKTELFFFDYSLSPLFVQENYIRVRPQAAQGKPKMLLSLLSRTADSICDGDLIDRSIRSRQNWSLLPAEALYASVVPGELMKGHLSEQIQFPAWLGNNSKRGKIDRLLQELTLHMRLRISGNKTDVNLEYSPCLLNAIVRPLQHQELDGVQDAIEVMESYDLLREDLDNLVEVCEWPGRSDPLACVNPKVKAAFTRKYNSDGHLIPYAITSIATKKSRRQGSTEFDASIDESEAEEEIEDDTVSNDAMVKVKPAPRSRKVVNVAVKPSTSGRGRGRGRSK